MSNNVTENVIEFPRDSKTASVTFCQGRFITKIKKLAKKYPDECEIIRENNDGSILAHIPVRWIKINNMKRELTDEQRAVAIENIKKAKESIRNKSNPQDYGAEDK